jgi:hypothetical protein
MRNWPNAGRWTAIFIGGICVVGLLGVLVTRAQLQEDRRDEQVSHLLQLDQRYASQPMIFYRKDYAVKRLRNQEDPDEEYQLIGFFESVGKLVQSGYLNGDDVYSDFSDDVFPLYADSRDTIEREHRAEPANYASFVSLVQTLKGISGKSGATDAALSKDAFKAHWEAEDKLLGDSRVAAVYLPPFDKR